MADLRPDDAGQLREAVASAVADGRTLEVRAGGSKTGLGRPVDAADRLDISALRGVIDYQPEELVLTARPATPLGEVEAILAQRGQHLAFEPADYGPFYGQAAGGTTLGGILAANVAGPRRIQAGAARDHFLGLAGVSGRGEAFKAGGKVVKNVTGYDLGKLLAGSHGTLAVLTEVSVKVLPAPEKTRTILILGLDDAAAGRTMTQALQSPHDVSAAAHLPARLAARSAVGYVRDAGAAVTAIRIEGFGPSVAARLAALRQALAAAGELEELHTHNSLAFWREIRDVRPLTASDNGDDRMVWRLSVPPAAGADVAATIGAARAADWFFDWGGGLVWLALDGGEDAAADLVRRAADAAGGYATLARAPAAVRRAVPVFHPQPEPLAALSARIKASFDPSAVLNPGRMYAGV